MEIVGDSLDDVLIKLYEELPVRGKPNTGTRGANTELLGVTLRIERPRARLSRSEDRGKPFSAVGELLWYLSGSDELEFIEPYIPRYAKDAVDGILQGAYGPRLLKKDSSINQIQNIVNLLDHNPGSRRAVIQLFDADDIEKRKKEIPCTTTLQFHLRNSVLHMSAIMRSNDAYFGLPHDVFCFTMLQEMVARRLGADLGTYIHHVGSIHVYEDYIDATQQYVDEGYQRPNEMPVMPRGDPFELIPKLLDAESRARGGQMFHADEIIDDHYWSDLIRLVQVFWSRRRREDLSFLRNSFANEVYLPYVTPLPQAAVTRAQLDSRTIVE